MNYQKTKVIKKMKIKRSVLLGLVVAAAFLLESCFSGGGTRGGSRGNDSLDKNTTEIKDLGLKREFQKKIGGWGEGCGYHCLLKQVAEDARNHKSEGKEVKKNDKSTLTIPKRKEIKYKNNKKVCSYFNAIGLKPVVGNKEGRRFFKKKFGLNQGIHGRMQEVYTNLLQGKSSDKDGYFFVVAKFMLFTEQVRKALLETPEISNDKGKLIAALKGYLQEFRSEVEKVKKDSPGMVVMIAEDPAYSPETDGLTFEENCGEGSKKNYVVGKDSYNWIQELCDNIEADIDEFAAKLS